MYFSKLNTGENLVHAKYLQSYKKKDKYFSIKFNFIIQPE